MDSSVSQETNAAIIGLANTIAKALKIFTVKVHLAQLRHADSAMPEELYREIEAMKLADIERGEELVQE